jgi:acetyl esterase
MTEPFVRPDVRAFLDAFEAQPRPIFNDELIKMIRQMPPEMMASSDLPVGELGEIRNVTMPGPGGDIALRLFDPRA